MTQKPKHQWLMRCSRKILLDSLCKIFSVHIAQYLLANKVFVLAVTSLAGLCMLGLNIMETEILITVHKVVTIFALGALLPLSICLIRYYRSKQKTEPRLFVFGGHQWMILQHEPSVIVEKIP